MGLIDWLVGCGDGDCVYGGSGRLVIWIEGSCVCCLDSGGEGSCFCCVDSGCGGIGHSVDWEGMIGRCHPNGDMGCCGSV